MSTTARHRPSLAADLTPSTSSGDTTFRCQHCFERWSQAAQEPYSTAGSSGCASGSRSCAPSPHCKKIANYFTGVLRLAANIDRIKH